MSGPHFTAKQKALCVGACGSSWGLGFILALPGAPRPQPWLPQPLAWAVHPTVKGGIVIWVLSAGLSPAHPILPSLLIRSRPVPAALTGEGGDTSHPRSWGLKPSTGHKVPTTQTDTEWKNSLLSSLFLDHSVPLLRGHLLLRLTPMSSVSSELYTTHPQS